MSLFPYDIVDLTHTLAETIPSWNGGCGFEHKVALEYDECDSNVKFRVHKLKMHAGIGTHIDAPAHCVPGGRTIEQLSLQQLAAPCVVIDISEHADENYSLSIQDIETFELRYGKIQAQSFLIVRTGWEKHWFTPEKYHNHHRFPSVSEGAVLELLKRDIVGLGIDTLSPDRPEDGFAVHQALLGSGKYIIENIANASALPPTGAFSLALPLKIQGGTESPLRLIALLPKRN